MRKRKVDEIVRQLQLKCVGCGRKIKKNETKVNMSLGIHCISCAENRGAFDRFQDV